MKTSSGRKTKADSNGGASSGSKSALMTILNTLDGSRRLCEQVHLSSELEQWIRHFRPEIVYTLLVDLTFIRLTQRISESFGAPTAIHFMDDWPSEIYRHGVFAPLLNSQMQSNLRQVVEAASLCLGISPAMCTAYTQRYGTRFQPFNNTLDVQAWLRKGKREWKPGERFRIIYSGSIEANQVEALKQVCDAAAGLRREGTDLEMRIYTPEFYAARYANYLRNEPAVTVLPVPVTQAEVAVLFTDADLLVAAVNFDAEAVSHFRYSMPTKLPAYMLSETPILLYGPEQVEFIRSAKSSGWGFAVTSEDGEGLRDALLRMIHNEELRRTLAMTARDIAVTNYDASRVRPAFHQVLADAAQKPRREFAKRNEYDRV